MEQRWEQPFRWGLLLAFDNTIEWELPDGVGDNHIRATATCLAVPVLSKYDVAIPDDWPGDAPLPEAQVEVAVGVDSAAGPYEFEAQLWCPSGRLRVGDAENERDVDVPMGRLRVEVTRDPIEFAQRVTLRVSSD